MSGQPGSILVVVGLAREARIAGGHAPVTIGTGGLESVAEGAVGLLSFGLCAALQPGLAVGDLIVGEGVGFNGEIHLADPSWSQRLSEVCPGARRGLTAGSRTNLRSPDEKAFLAATSGAMAADMESHGVAVAARRLGLPFAILRAVSDTADRALPRAAIAGFRSDGQPDVAAVVATLLWRPWEGPSLVRTAVEAGAGFRALERVAPAALAVKP